MKNESLADSPGRQSIDPYSLKKQKWRGFHLAVRRVCIYKTESYQLVAS